MTADTFLTTREFRRFVALLSGSRSRGDLLTSAESCELIRLSEKASDFEHRDAEEELDKND